MAGTPPKNFAPKSGQENNRQIVVIRSSSHSVSTYARRSIAGIGARERIVRNLHRGEPLDQAKSVTDSFVEPSGTVDCL